ncbi:PfkB family carbohydrate kinase [Lichenihabitans sp. Uapishka_5]|uniref:carbohydrate kinase family protein n=1 Tax=Lichenihabitans sp. Uapishka_5 TaxID=3037302 RepID=UPI0029E7F096|nr:PfkB family carbohydrate kinase [Lichenihabitans sp. Uapishka_5]MDX7952114.1 PfkB family carbohydrate kinase [Lichenihabitans sp. Uapishka_5]
MTLDYTAMGFITFDCLGWPVTAIPEGGGTTFIDDLTLAVSGAAGTAAIAAAKMGLSCRAVGGVGPDMMGDWVLQRLNQFGIDTSAMQRRPGWRTSSSIVTTRPDGARPALHMKGATGDFFIDDDLAPQVIDARVVHFGGVGLMTRMDEGRNAELARRAQAAGAITTADIFAGSAADMPAVASILPYTDYFMPSIEEAHALTGRHDLEGTAAFFIDKGVRCCVFTLGQDGAYYHHQNGTRFTLPAYEVPVRCTCGCGDAFDAGFAVALIRGMDAETAVRFAQATAALNATGLGSQAGVEDFDATWAFMERTPLRRSPATLAAVA